MLKLFQLLFIGHVHKWTILRHGAMKDLDYDGTRIGTVYELQCQHCGNVKRTDLMPKS